MLRGQGGAPPPGYPPWRCPKLMMPLFIHAAGWMNILILLMIGAFFSKVCLYIVLALWSTLLLPCRPVLWPAFNRLWIFKTWRHYFHYRRGAGGSGGQGRHRGPRTPNAPRSAGT